MEKTLVLIKPDAVQRALIGEILKRFEQRGLKIIAMKMVHVTREFAETHYAEHAGKSFFESLVGYITSSPLVALVIEGPRVISAVRQMAGKTNPLEADPGTIRHDFGIVTGRNLLHASDSPESAEKEIALWFQPQEICPWTPDNERWVFQEN